MEKTGMQRRRFLATTGSAGMILTMERAGLLVPDSCAAQAQPLRTPVYWDPDAGVDADGRGFSMDMPLKTLDYCLRRHLASDRQFLQKRGTTYRMSGSSMPQGMLGAFVGAAQNVTFSSYGTSKEKARIVCTDAVESIFYFKDVSGWVVEGYDLDGADMCRYGLIQVRASARDVIGGTIVDCNIHHSAGHGVYIHTANSVYPFTRLPALSNVRIERVVSHHNRRHGFVHGGMTDRTEYTNCVAHHNGKSGDGSGWHGFSALAHRQSTGGYGPKNEIPWERLANNIWRTPLFPGQGAEVFRVSTRLGTPYSKLKKNTATPTTPRPGEFGCIAEDNVLRWPGGDRISSGYLYVNVGDKDVGGTHRHGFQYAYTDAKRAVYTRCTAHHNHDDSSKHGYIEGTGFQFDDFSSDGRYVACLSYQNEGCGFQFNMGDNNQLIGCIAWGNDSMGFFVQKHTGAVVVNSVFDDNSVNSLGRRQQAAENAVTNDSAAILFQNNIVRGRRGLAVMFASGSDAGSTSRNNCISGFDRTGLGGVISGTISADPGFVDAGARNYRLRTGSPCLQAGIDPGFVPTSFDGNPMGKPYDIGAYDSRSKSTGTAILAAGDQGDVTVG
jgi:hypothetical protein